MQAYLQRIGYHGDRALTYENLAELIRCHLETVPFENLDFWHNPRELSLKQEDLYEKIVLRRRGGVCFELNGLFCWLLREFGFEVYPVCVRVLLGPAPNPLSHQGNIVVLDGRKYYCDVGFGGPGPKGVVALEDGGIYTIGGGRFRVEWDDVCFTIQSLHKDEWMPLLRGIDLPANTGDFSILLYYFTNHPASHFVRNRVINLCLPDGFLALTNNTLTGKQGDTPIAREVPEAEIPSLLRESFGLTL